MEVDVTSNVRRRATVLSPKLLLKTPGKTRVSYPCQSDWASWGASKASSAMGVKIQLFCSVTLK